MKCPNCQIPFYGFESLPEICPRCKGSTFTHPTQEELDAPSPVLDNLNYKDWCPECKRKSVIKQDGCEHCEVCGWGQCG